MATVAKHLLLEKMAKESAAMAIDQASEYGGLEAAGWSFYGNTLATAREYGFDFDDANIAGELFCQIFAETTGIIVG